MQSENYLGLEARLDAPPSKTHFQPTGRSHGAVSVLPRGLTPLIQGRLSGCDVLEMPALAVS
jgi:hypothetical protein